MVRRVVGWLIVVGIFPSVVAAGTVPLLGPEQFVRTSGATTVYTRSVIVPPNVGAPYLISVINGSPDAASNGSAIKGAVSSGAVLVNGIGVVSESEFSKIVSEIKKEITLTPSSTLEVRLNSAPDSYVTLTISGMSMNNSPVAHAGLDQGVVVGAPALLDGGGSFDLDGDALTYQWSFSALPAGSASVLTASDTVSASFTPDVVGDYAINLVVSDGVATSAADGVVIVGLSPEPILKKTIGPAGGILELQGTENKVEMFIPAGALATDTEITIRQVPTPGPERFWNRDAIPVGDTFSFEPHGLVFSEVVWITFTYRDEDLPPGVDEGRIAIYMSHDPNELFEMEGGAVCSPDEETGPHCVDTESIAQENDLDKNEVSVRVNTLSEGTLGGLRNLQALQDAITGCNGSQDAHPTIDYYVAEDGFKLTLLGCPRPDVSATRPEADITRIVLHSTSNSNVPRTFADEVSSCAIRPNKCKGFAHYYMGRDGSIVQVALDALLAVHTRTSTSTAFPPISNGNSIGIEIFNNVGEPYDGRQVTSLIRLIDFLIRLHPTIPRPSYPRDLATTSIFVHQETDPARRLDPVGIFRTSVEKVVFDRVIASDRGVCVDTIVNGKTKKNCPFISVEMPGVSEQAVTLFDAVVAGVSAMGGDFKGLVNTQGGDALWLAQAGSGGDITYKGREAIPVGTNHTDNLPLIVGPGETVVLPTTADYTDILISPGGVVQLEGDTTLSASGTVWVGPVLPETATTAAVPPGRIVTSDSLNGNALTLNANGSPLLNGIVDLRGKNAVVSPSDGGKGGVFSVATASFGPHFIPTLVTRGGDADDVSCESAQVESSLVCDLYVAGGGGNVVIGRVVNPGDQLFGDILLSGTNSSEGVVNTDGTIPAESPWFPDTLPPRPPTIKTTAPETLTADGRLVLLNTAFLRGILTTGGMGGAGTDVASGFGGGGQGGDGGEIFISSNADEVGARGGVVFRDVDLLTGGHIESVKRDVSLTQSDGGVVISPRSVTLTSRSGSNGGVGAKGDASSRGGDGGRGGIGGTITCEACVLNPMPDTFVRTAILVGGGDGENPNQVSTATLGETVAVLQGTEPLYRVKVALYDGAEKALGGLGGFPGGSSRSGSEQSEEAGFWGLRGDGGPITGLPTE
jgi:hypothetical protein